MTYFVATQKKKMAYSNICTILFISYGNKVKRFPSRFLILLVVFKAISHVNGQDEPLLVYANDDIRLNCSPTFEYQPEWQHLRDGNKKPVKLSFGDELLDRYASNKRFNIFMDPQQRRYDLLINNVVNGDAGIYTCNEDTIERRKIKLTVQKRMTKLLKSPTNTAVLSGESVQLNCSTSYSEHVYWQHTPYHSQTLQGVYYGSHGLQGQYTTDGRYAMVVNESIGQYDLTIRSVKPSDAGTFTCLDNDGEGEKVSAELIVLGSVPSCVSNSTPEGAILANNKCGLDADFIKVTCNVIYFGHQPPTLKWFIGNTSADEFPQTSSNSTHQATTEIILEAKEWMRSTPIHCRITEPPWNNIQECSSLVKLHEFSHAREPVSISCIPLSDIKCDAGSTGECVYEWKNEKGEVVNKDQFLQHQNVTPGKYTCFSTCEIGGVRCTRASFIVNLASTTVCEFMRWICAVSGILAALAIIAVLLYYRFPRKFVGRWLHKMHPRHDPNMQDGEKDHLNEVSSNSATGQRNLRLLDKFGEDKNEYVCGIAVLNTNVYLIRNQATLIEVYSFKFGKYNKITEIKVTGFSKVRYMAACGFNQRIYISDGDNFTIHTVQYYKDEAPNGSKYEPDSFHVDHEPEGLSVTQEGNIVITFQKDNQLGIYDKSGKHIKSIDFAESIRHLWYAEAINNNEYLIHHGAGEDTQITKVVIQSPVKNAPSDVSITYKDPQWKGARSFARTGEGFIFLGDFEQHQILLLDPNLKFVKIMASELHKPIRLCYDEKSHHLYVTNQSSKDVYVFEYDAA